MTPARQCFVSKWSAENLGTGKNLKKWQMRHSSLCPFCMEEEEDIEHILRCQSPTAVNGWNISLQQFGQQLHKIWTSPTLIISIIEQLRTWKSHSQHHVKMFPTDIQAILQKQQEIGWKQFLEGLVTQSLYDYQQEFLDLSDTKTTITTWGPKFLRTVWDFTFSIWHQQKQTTS